MPLTSNPENLEFRAAPNGYVVWTIIFGGLGAAMVWGGLFRHPSFWQAAALCACILVFSYVWLAALKVTITADELRFRTLLGERRMRHADIALIRLGFDLGHGGGPLRLFVEPKDSERAAAMSINAKVLPPEAIRAVLELGKRVAGADSGDFEDGLVRRAYRRKTRTKRDKTSH